MQVVYLDVLFIINFCMDFIALYISGYFLHIKRSKKLIAVSSLLGGAYAVLSVIFDGNAVFNYFIGIAVSFLLCYITYSKEITKLRYLRLCAVFYFVSILLGGAITAFYNLLNTFFASVHIESQSKNEHKTLLFVLMSFFCAGLIMVFSHIFTKEVSSLSCKLTVSINGKTKTVHALIDSGNFLTDPISGKKVVIVNYESISSILPPALINFVTNQFNGFQDLKLSDAKRIKIIPAKAITGEKLLTGYIPDFLKIETECKGKVNTSFSDAIIGLDASKEKFAGYDAIIPHSLL